MSCDYKVPSKIAIFVMNSRRRYKQNLDAYSIHEGSIMQGDTASAQRGHFLRCLLYLVFLLSILLFNSAISPVMADSSSVPSEPYEATESADYSNANGDFWESFWDQEALEEQNVSPSDPIKGINRVLFDINDAIYVDFLSPISNGYTKVVPTATRKSISNFFKNWSYPVRLVNNLLQGKFKGAEKETTRFLINTSWGILGFFDPATDKIGKLPPPEEDLGQTLGRWGIPSGPFIILPVLGPTNLRDLVGTIGDHFLNPVNYLNDTKLKDALRIEGFLNESPELMEKYKELKSSAVSPYSALRDIYYQQRAKVIKD